MGNLKINPITGKMDLIATTSSGGTIIDNNRVGTQELTAGANRVDFTSTFTTGYRLQISCYSGQTQIAYQVTGKDADGFDITCQDDCTMEYIALEDK